jgi:hypothetical protein
VQIQVYSNYDPWGVTIGKNIFTYINIEKHLLQNQLANFNQIWYKSSLGEENDMCTIKWPGALQRGDNYKKAKMGWGHLKSSPREPLGQKSSGLHESFLTLCKLKFAPEVCKGHNMEIYFYMLTSSPNTAGQYPSTCFLIVACLFLIISTFMSMLSLI